MRVGKENDRVVESLKTATNLALKNEIVSFKALEIVSLEPSLAFIVAHGDCKHFNPSSFRKR